jgi:hypothetical protein
MKLPIFILVSAASAVACSRASRPAEPTAPPPPTRVEIAQVSESAPPPTGIPTNNPPVAPPPAAVSPPADETPLTLTPASGVGGARTASAQLVPSATHNDRPHTTADQESIREIRALLAEDPALAPMAARVNIVARSGRVWLRGQVNTAEQRAAIEKAARRAAGVIDVNNELVVMAE